ncbi:Rv3235 family protein [Trueperella pecoris]|uniref:3-hydroxyacyl-CoA dehydrogenase n=1 Tax=Trueperella pecoris TaxID=2733571 RepID=A0A7M1QVU5_9ACTO|nr:Rv3235 family protein [Trueperella pecoris]QOQ39290.1 hypothetical protein HLG82_07435 [Trueperella pecoris]QOR46068.1 hypothetical protein INS88_02295 [Trueperella pecoris]QTG75900.1 hypothetical protein J4179_02225 [Trueperella pecoris]
MSQLAVLEPPRTKSYPGKTATTLAAPALNAEDLPKFDRAAFSSPKLDRRMYRDGPLDVVPDALVPPDRFAASIVGQAIEVLMGHRPVRQLQTWMHPSVYEALSRRAGLGHRIHGKPEKCRSPRIKRVRVCEPRDGVAEASLVVFDGHKIRAAATRLEVRRGRWHVTALEII